MEVLEGEGKDDVTLRDIQKILYSTEVITFHFLLRPFRFGQHEFLTEILILLGNVGGFRSPRRRHSRRRRDFLIVHLHRYTTSRPYLLRSASYSYTNIQHLLVSFCSSFAILSFFKISACVIDRVFLFLPLAFKHTEPYILFQMGMIISLFTSTLLTAAEMCCTQSVV